MESYNCKEDIGFLIRQIDLKLKAFADMEMKTSDLTYSQFHVLGFLARNGQEASQKEIEDYLGVAHPTVVGLVSRLEKKGFIETRTDETDRRIKRVKTTSKALELGDRLMRGRRKGEALLRKNLSDEEAAELIRMLNIVSSNLEEADA